MNLLNELLKLTETKEKNLLGFHDDGTEDYDCRYMELTSLKGCPTKIIGDFDCSDNQLTSLEFCPKKVEGYFNCNDNQLTTLKNIHKQVTEIKGEFLTIGNDIKSHVLGLLLIKGCTEVKLENKEVEDILNKYLPNTRGNKAVIECQSDLLDADLDDFAEL